MKKLKSIFIILLAIGMVLINLTVFANWADPNESDAGDGEGYSRENVYCEHPRVRHKCVSGASPGCTVYICHHWYDCMNDICK